MSATVVVSIIWDGTRITVTNDSDSDSDATKVLEVVGMLRDAARRAEDAVISGTEEKGR